MVIAIENILVIDVDGNDSNGNSIIGMPGYNVTAEYTMHNNIKLGI